MHRPNVGSHGEAFSHELGTPVPQAGVVKSAKKGAATALFLCTAPDAKVFFLRILVHLVIYDSGKVSLEHRLVSW